MLGDIINPFLAEEDVCPGCDNLIHNILDHPLFFIKEGLELIRACDVDLGVDLGFLELDCGIQEENLCVLHLFRHCRVDPFLVDEYSLNDLRVVNGSTDFLLHLDVIFVDRPVVIGYHHDSLYHKVTELLL